MELSKEDTEELLSHFQGSLTGFIRYGPKGYLFNEDYKDDADKIYNLPIKENDIFVTTFPRSGTTWTQELVWLVANDLDYETAKTVLLNERYFAIGISMLTKPSFNIVNHLNGDLNDIKELPSPRFFKTHVPLSLLPPRLLDSARVVYVARDPRDVVVSCYHLKKSIKHFNFNGDLKTFWNLFLENKVLMCPYFEHLKEAWQQRSHPNMLFLFYEELSKDMPAVIRRVAKFLNKRLDDEQIQRLCQHLSFDQFKNNDAVNRKNTAKFVNSGEEDFIRRGKAGGWRDYFDAEMTAQAQRWMEHNLQDTDLRFPQ